MGAFFDNSFVGAVWSFGRTSTGWTQDGSKHIPTSGEELGEGFFGNSVALSSDGATAIVGAENENTGRGAAWTFVSPPPVTRTGSASNIGLNTATLSGSIELGGPGTAHFEYGTSTTYGNSSAPQAVEVFPPSGPLSPAIGLAGTISADVSGLSPNTTYHYRLVVQNSAGASVGGDQTFTTLIAPCGCVGLVPPPHALRPTFANVSQSHARWRAGSAAARLVQSGGDHRASLAKSKAKVRRPPLGTTFSFTLNTAARVQLTFTRKVAGREVKGRCKSQNASNKRKPPCKRTISPLAFRVSAKSGAQKLSFQGSAAGKRLSPGTYTVTLVASNAGLSSAPKSLTFAIVR